MSLASITPVHCKFKFLLFYSLFCAGILFLGNMHDVYDNDVYAPPPAHQGI